MHLVVEEEPEVGVVAEGHDVAAALGGLDQDVPDGVGLGRGDGVAGGVVREVEEDDELAPARVLGDGLARSPSTSKPPARCRAAGSGRSSRPRLTAEDQQVVAPQLVGEQQQVALVDEHVGHGAQPVRDAAGDHRQADGHVAQRRVLLPDLLPPGLAQVGPAGGRGVRKHVVGARGRRSGTVMDAEAHGVLGLPGLADGGVEAVGLLVGLGRLGEDPLGEVELAAERGEHPHDGGRFPLDGLVEFDGQGVHAAPHVPCLAETFFESRQLLAQLGRQPVAELIVVLGQTVGFLLPASLVDGQQLLHGRLRRCPGRRGRGRPGPAGSRWGSRPLRRCLRPARRST